MITINHLCKAYPNVTPLKDVNAEINQGEIISIIGPSGTGKSTLLRCINRLEIPTGGEIIVDGINILDKKTNIYKIRQKMGMVFQSFNLFSHLMIIENIMLGPVNLLGHTKQDAYDYAVHLLRMVGLAEKACVFPHELSGGQKQRAAIARTLAMKPEIILFDEPTSALDPTMVGEVLGVIRTLAKEGLTMMIVTHEMKFAKDVSDRIFYMDEGFVYEEGTPDQIFDYPQKEKTRAFIKQLKTFHYTITSKDFDKYNLDSEIDKFGRQQFLSQKKISVIQLLFEELGVQKILQHFSANPFHLEFQIGYSEIDNLCELSFTYDGEKYNPFEIEDPNDLSLSIINHYTKSRDEKFDNGINKLSIVI